MISPTFSHLILLITTMMALLTSKVVNHSKYSSNNSRTSLLTLFLTWQTYTPREELTLAITNLLLLTQWISVTLINNKIPSCQWLNNSSNLSNSSKQLKVVSNPWDLRKCNSNSSNSNNNNNSSSSNSISYNSSECNNSHSKLSSNNLCSTIMYQICNNLSLCNNLRVFLKEILLHNQTNNSKSTSRVQWKTTDKLSHWMAALMISKLPSQLTILQFKTFTVAL